MLLFCKRLTHHQNPAILPVAVLGIYPKTAVSQEREENRLPHYDNESRRTVVLEEYRKHVAERAAEGLRPNPWMQTKWPRL